MTHQPHHNEDATLKPVAPTVTPQMVEAYLRANDAYWKRTDELPTPPNKWRTGTVAEATAESLRAALSAAPVEPVAVVAATDLHRRTLMTLLDCCEAKRPDALVIGRVRAEDAAQAIRAYLDARHAAAELAAAIPAVLTQVVEADKLERALSELVDKIVPGLDTGDILADALTASKALDKKEPRNG